MCAHVGDSGHSGGVAGGDYGAEWGGFVRLDDEGNVRLLSGTGAEDAFHFKGGHYFAVNFPMGRLGFDLNAERAIAGGGEVLRARVGQGKVDGGQAILEGGADHEKN